MHMGNWGHDYAEAGNEVSLPYNGSTRAIHVYDWGTGPPGPNGQDLHYLIDFTPGAGFSNARPLTGSLAPRIDIAFTFSSNPATPYYAYVATNSGIRRIDIRGTPVDPTTPIEAPGDGWPRLDETNAIWLHQS